MTTETTDAARWYTIDGVGVTDLAEVCRDQYGTTISNGKLLILFDSEREADLFESVCKRHRHLAVRKISRVKEPEPTVEQKRRAAWWNSKSPASRQTMLQAIHDGGGEATVAACWDQFGKS